LWPAVSVLSVVLLGALGTGVAYLLNYGIISGAGATIATTVGYVMPLVSIVAGIAVLGERLTWNDPVGAAIIVAGAALTHARQCTPRAGGMPAAVPVGAQLSVHAFDGTADLVTPAECAYRTP
jgi:drug/metabolite transporter (DMT)-like permease